MGGRPTVTVRAYLALTAFFGEPVHFPLDLCVLLPIASRFLVFACTCCIELDTAGSESGCFVRRLCLGLPPPHIVSRNGCRQVLADHLVLRC